PGRPTLGMPRMRPGDPPADAIVHLQDVPVTIRYRLEPPQMSAPTAADVALETAKRFASARAGREGSCVDVDLANGTWLEAWVVEAGAIASYEMTRSGDRGDREEVFVLVKNGLVMTITWTYPAGFAHDPAYAALASVAEATMTWDPSRGGEIA